MMLEAKKLDLILIWKCNTQLITMSVGIGSKGGALGGVYKVKVTKMLCKSAFEHKNLLNKQHI